jgi:hypothetical protein
VHIKRGALILGIFCMGTAFALASSEQKSASADVIDAVEKDRSSADQPGRSDPETSQVDSRLDLSAIRRIVPSKVKRADLFDPKSWLSSISPSPSESFNPPQRNEKTQVAGQAHTNGQAQQKVPAQQQPTVPELPFTFVGRMIDGNEVSLFLSRNDRQYVAKVNDVLDNSYRVDKITAVSAVLTYLPMNTQQTLTFNSTAVGSSFLSESSTNTLPLPLPPQIQQQPSNLLTTK